MRAKEVWRRTKETAKDLSLQLAMIPLAAGIYGAGLYFSSTSPVIGFHDCNNDGVKDALVALPLRGTESALLGFIDGTNLIESGIEIESYHYETPSFLGSEDWYSCIKMTGLGIPEVEIDPLNFHPLGNVVPRDVNKHPSRVYVFKSDNDDFDLRFFSKLPSKTYESLATLPK